MLDEAIGAPFALWAEFLLWEMMQQNVWDGYPPVSKLKD